jgi:hypothetical protein
MAVTIKQNISISIADSKKEWSVPCDAVKTVDGQQFVKLSASRSGFPRLVFHDVKVDKNISISSCYGWSELQKLRFDAPPADMVGQDGEPKEALFQPKAKVKKPKKLSGMDTICLCVLPAQGEFHGGSIKCLSAYHPCEDVWVLLETSTLEMVIQFVRAFGIDPESRRAYNNNEESDKLIKMGGGRVAKKQKTAAGRTMYSYVTTNKDE